MGEVKEALVSREAELKAKQEEVDLRNAHLDKMNDFQVTLTESREFIIKFFYCGSKGILHPFVCVIHVSCSNIHTTICAFN